MTDEHRWGTATWMIIAALPAVVIGAWFGGAFRDKDSIALLATTHKYEWYYDIAEAYKLRVGQIAENKGDVEEAIGLRNICRDLATRYNASAAKADQGLFKSPSLPPRLEVAACDV